jgi:2,3-dihydroxybenzoate-AMP ligase
MSSPTMTASVTPYDQASVVAYREAGRWTGRSLPADLVAAAERHGARTALIAEGRSWTFTELFGQARRLATGLIGSGVVRPGEPVMFQMGNVAETAVAYLACLLAAAPPVCTLPMHGTREIGLLARHVGARTLITQDDFGSG